MNDDTPKFSLFIFVSMVYIGGRLLWSSSATIEAKIIVILTVILTFIGSVLHVYLIDQLEEAELRRGSGK